MVGILLGRVELLDIAVLQRRTFYMLNFNIRGENIEVTPAIRDYVEGKVEKVERYFNDELKANANVNLKVYNDKQTKVEVTIPMKNLTLRAEERNDDMYAAIDLIVDKLERQIRKYKTKEKPPLPCLKDESPEDRSFQGKE